MLLFIDTETTGIPTRRGASHTDVSVWPRIVSISWLLCRSASDVACRAHHIIQPGGFTIPADASRVHGISTERALRDGRPLHSVLSELHGNIDSFRPTTLIAHNIAFDRPIVLAEAFRLGIRSPLETLPTVCTMQASTGYCRIPRPSGGYKWPTLAELHRCLFGVELTAAHDAGNDVLAAMQCYFRLIELSVIRC